MRCSLHKSRWIGSIIRKYFFTVLVLLISFAQQHCLAFNKALMGSNFIIVANVPFTDPQIIVTLSSARKIIALDGAADKLLDAQIIPDIIMGDFDSINKSKWGIKEGFDQITDKSPSYTIRKNNKTILVVPTKDQNFTDLEKAITFCDEHSSPEILILNAVGGRMDHSLGNIRALRKFHNPARLLRIRTDTQTLEMAKNDFSHQTGKDFHIYGDKGDYCGIMAFPDAHISTSGLVYDVTNFHLEFGYNESICNSFKTTKAIVTIHKGEALLIYPNPKKMP